MAKKTIKIRVQGDTPNAVVFEDTVAHYTKGDWAVTDFDGKPYNRFRYFNYWLTHIPTGSGCGLFRTQKTAIAACKEVASLPCDAHIATNGKQVWKSIKTQSAPIRAALQKWVDSEKDKDE